MFDVCNILCSSLGRAAEEGLQTLVCLLHTLVVVGEIAEPALGLGLVRHDIDGFEDLIDLALCFLVKHVVHGLDVIIVLCD